MSMAAEAPVIRPSTVSIQNSTISFRFDADVGLVNRFKLESATGLTDPAQWTTVSGSSVTEQMSGLYEVSASLPTNQAMSFYRIAVLSPPTILFINEAGRS